ncbi:MAG: isoaspartyl peptidase/L-asparaginase [Candidatus Desulforudis sp.]|nr:isoaspartyl peptidase/L-asparaginase [Desulforudis sp.]
MQILAVHGGLDTSRERSFMDDLEAAVRKGFQMLATGRVPALEAVLNVLEDSPRFNCGFGSVLNLDGKVEMDAAIVDGPTHRFAAVAAIRAVANPVSVARKLLEETKQVILAGEGAVKFAREHGFPEADCTSRQQLEAWHKAKDSLARGKTPAQNLYTGLEYHGDTVGCLVWDGQGLTAASTTGGYSLKLPGRVGDTPSLGGGIYASRTSATVCTGLGEAFIETLTAKYVDEQIAAGAHPQEAVEAALRRLAGLKGAEGGIMALDARGRIGAAFNAGRFPVVVLVNGEVRKDFQPVNLRPELATTPAR